MPGDHRGPRGLPRFGPAGTVRSTGGELHREVPPPPGHRRQAVGSPGPGCVDATVCAYNPDRQPKVDGNVVYPHASVDPFADLMAEINSEPEFAEPDAVREAARSRLDDADLVQRVLF